VPAVIRPLEIRLVIVKGTPVSIAILMIQQTFLMGFVATARLYQGKAAVMNIALLVVLMQIRPLLIPMTFVGLERACLLDRIKVTVNIIDAR